MLVSRDNIIYLPYQLMNKNIQLLCSIVHQLQTFKSTISKISAEPPRPSVIERLHQPRVPRFPKFDDSRIQHETTINCESLWVYPPRWWLNQPICKIKKSKWIHLPQIRDENKQYLKPPGSPLWYLWYSKVPLLWRSLSQKKMYSTGMYRIAFKEPVTERK